MANDFYQVQRRPSERTRAKSGIVSAELDSIQEGFEQLPSKNQLAGNVQLVTEETAESATNVYILKGFYPITDLLKGTEVVFFCQNTNTAESTANVDGTGEKDIKAINGDSLVGSEIVAGRPVKMMYNGTHFRLLNSAKTITVGIVLSSALTPRNFAINDAITAFILPTASGGSSPYTYEVSGLPTGLLFTESSREVSGTPSALGSSTVTYTITDSNALEFNFQFVINVVPTLLTLPDPTDRTLKVGSSYTFNLPEAAGGTSPYTYLVEDLPSGLLFDSESREISGSPLESAVYEVTYIVTDSASTAQSTSQEFTLTVRSATTLALADLPDREFVPDQEITPFTLPAATGGVQPYSYIVTGLGEGFSFDEDTRVVSGTPSTIGVRQATFRVVDAQNTEVDEEFEISVDVPGRRYIAVHGDRNLTATDLQSGNSYLASEQELEIPGFTGERYIAIAQPEDNEDLTSISLAGLGNSISDFEKMSYTRTIDSFTYSVWVSRDLQGDVISGEILEVRP